MLEVVEMILGLVEGSIYKGLRSPHRDYRAIAGGCLGIFWGGIAGYVLWLVLDAFDLNYPICFLCPLAGFLLGFVIAARYRRR